MTACLTYFFAMFLQELEPILKQLDPDGHGKITFEDFCERVKEITKGWCLDNIYFFETGLRIKTKE